MFLSTGDLRKAVPKRAPVTTVRPKPAGSAGVSGAAGQTVGQTSIITEVGVAKECALSHHSVVGSAQSIAEIARQERQARLEERELTQCSRRIQRWYRLHSARRDLCILLSSTIQSKVGDLRKLTALLLSRGVKFIPPADTAMSILAQTDLLMRLSRRNQPDIIAGVALCLLPTSQPPQASVFLSRLARLAVRAVGVLTQLPSAEATQVAGALANAVRGTVLEQPALSLGLSDALDAFYRCAADRMVNIRIKDGSQPGLASLGVVLGPEAELWSLARLFLLTNPRAHGELWCLPGLSLLIPKADIIANSEELHGYMKAFAYQRPNLYGRANLQLSLLGQESRHGGGGLQLGQYLLGNLMHCLHIVLAAGMAVENSFLVAGYVRIILDLLQAFPIPGLLQGTVGVVCNTRGVSTVASAVPACVVAQASLLYDSSLLVTLMSSGLLPAAQDVPSLQCFVSSKDAEDSRTALATTSQSIVQAMFKEQQDAAVSWGSWARRLLHPLVPQSSASPVSTSSSSGGGWLSGWFGKSARRPSASSGNAPVALPSAPPNVLQEPIAGLLAHILSPAAHHPQSLPWRALVALAFKTDAYARSCTFSLSSCALVCIQRLCKGGVEGLAADLDPRVLLQDPQTYPHANLLFLLAAALRVELLAVDDVDLYSRERPFPLPLLLPVVRALRTALFGLLQYTPGLLDRSEKDPSTVVWAATNMAAVLSELHGRWARRPFASGQLWALDDAHAIVRALERLAGPDSEIADKHSLVCRALLRHMAYMLPFRRRLQHLRALLDADRLAIQGSNDALYLQRGGHRSQGHVLHVNRGRVLEDSLRQLSSLPAAQWRDRLCVRYVNSLGQEEAGIDAGGLFKDFLTDVSAQAFDLSLGLFAQTQDHLLFPNPSATALYPDPHELDRLYNFLGRVVGKAIFENIPVAPQFAFFFLNAFLSRQGADLLNDLYTFDTQVYKNLTFLKTYEGDIEDLALTFTVTDEALGGSTEVDLVPGGGSVAVTKQNRHRYVHLVAKYYLHDRIKRQAGAFFRGLHEVLGRREALDWFCAPELQVLVSGAGGAVDVDDLRAHCSYAGYLPVEANVRWLWEVVAEMTPEDRAALLHFVTACPRSPPLGFAALSPPFTVQKVPCSDDQRLPTASTCFNILKLPTYSSKQRLRDKLLQAIRAKAGFDLS